MSNEICQIRGVIDEADDVVAYECDKPEPELLDIIFTKNGFVGSGNVKESVESIKVAVDIGGRSDASACVHKRPT